MTPTKEVIEYERGHLVRGGRTVCWHRWHIDEIVGIWRYRECDKCQRRIADRVTNNLRGPCDWNFLNTGIFGKSPFSPPPKPREA